MIKRIHRRRRLIIWSLTALVVFAAASIATVTFFHQKPKPTGVTGNSYTKGVSSKPAQSSTASSPPPATSNTNTSSTDKQLQGTTTNNTPNAPLKAPWGSFVNVYTAKTTDEMGSTCNTTPGATCQITFTNGTSTKSLDAETTDAGGAVYWAWTPASIGLTPGTWHITATAVLGTQSMTTNNDPLTLAITQ